MTTLHFGKIFAVRNLSALHFVGSWCHGDIRYAISNLSAMHFVWSGYCSDANLSWWRSATSLAVKNLTVKKHLCPAFCQKWMSLWVWLRSVAMPSEWRHRHEISTNYPQLSWGKVLQKLAKNTQSQTSRSPIDHVMTLTPIGVAHSRTAFFLGFCPKTTKGRVSLLFWSFWQTSQPWPLYPETHDFPPSIGISGSCQDVPLL